MKVHAMSVGLVIKVNDRMDNSSRLRVCQKQVGCECETKVWEREGWHHGCSQDFGSGEDTFGGGLVVGPSRGWSPPPPPTKRNCKEFLKKIAKKALFSICFKEFNKQYANF